MRQPPSVPVKGCHVIRTIAGLLDVGSDTGTRVADSDYQLPFAFTGRLEKVMLTIDRPQLSPADIEKAQEGDPQEQGERVVKR